MVFVVSTVVREGRGVLRLRTVVVSQESPHPDGPDSLVYPMGQFLEPCMNMIL